MYLDGRLDFAPPDGRTGTTWLGDQQTPSLDEINQQSEFTATAIEAVDFELIWQRALASRR